MTTTTEDTTAYDNLRIKQKAQTKSLVYGTAREMFLVYGYEDTGLREIAKKIGMSTGAVNANCDGKADLYQRAIGHRPVLAHTGAYAAAALAALAYKHREGPGITDQDLVDLANIGMAMAGIVEFNMSNLNPTMSLEQMREALTPTV